MTGNTSTPQTKSLAAFIACGMALLLAVALNPAFAYADDLASVQAEADTAYASLKTMQSTLDVATEDYNQAVMDQEQAHKKIDEAQATIDEQTAKIESYQKQLSTRARSMYRSGSSSFLDVLLGSATFDDFATNWDVLNSLNSQDAQLVADTKSARETIEASKQTLAEQEKLAEQKTTEAKQNLDEAQATMASMQSVYDNLSAEAASLMQQQRDAQTAAATAAVQAATDGNANAGGSSSGGSSSGGGATYEGGGDVVSRAYACLGAPYNSGGVGPYEYDCSGLVSYCITGSHTRLGTTYTFMTYPQCDPYPGCICTNWGHCGIYIGGGQMINASDYGVGVIISSVQSGMIYVTP